MPWKEDLSHSPLQGLIIKAWLLFLFCTKVKMGRPEFPVSLAKWREKGHVVYDFTQSKVSLLCLALKGALIHGEGATDAENGHHM